MHSDSKYTRLSGNAQRIIDVHHHFEPSAKNVDGTAWSIERALDELDRNAVTAAIGYAGPVFDDDVASGRRRAHETNEWSTQLCRNHPRRFGLFASLPLSDVEGSLAEIAHAFDELHADGIGLATHYDGLGLGDAKFRPIFEELDHRKAVVYVHPAGAPCSTASTLTYESDLISAPWIEFPTNTARTILSLWTAGIPQRFSGLTFIFCHGGGVMPILLGRIAGFANWVSVGPERLATLFPDGVYAEFAKLYFECAQAFAPETIALLRTIVPAEHLLYGSDFSYFPVSHSIEQFARLDLPDDVRTKIAGGNAAALLPRWRLTPGE
jgi:predicted TIM-barrel fold metal-dependent hydrolase